MRRSIHINQAQMLRRSETEQQVTCAMCLEAITDSTKTTLDSCSHTYCFDCISRWVQEVESICPQCLRPVAQLCRLQTNGSIAETSVRLRRREEEVDNCFACKGIINLADIVMQFREQDQLDSWISSRCKVCSSLCIHTSCMHEKDRGIWQASAEWTCPACGELGKDYYSDDNTISPDGDIWACGCIIKPKTINTMNRYMFKDPQKIFM